MAFGRPEFTALMAALESSAMRLGEFERVNAHKPQSAPGSGLWLSVYLMGIRPLPLASGLAAVSGLVTFGALIGTSALQRPPDAIEPAVAGAALDLMAAYAGGFTVGGTVRNIDLLGEHGRPLSADAHYITIDSHQQRVLEVTVPVVISDMYTEAA